jgi:DNA-directed RNA polymerase subunit beta'
MEVRGQLARSKYDKSVVRATIAGTVTSAADGKVVIHHNQAQERSYQFGSRESMLVKTGSVIGVGDPLNIGHFNLQELLEKKGVYEVQNYVIQEVQHIYASQGQTINDKHLEIIVRKMFSKVRITDAGDTPFLAGEVCDKGDVDYENERLAKQKKRPAGYEQLLLGITRVALATDSWLSGASFQETIRVLVDAATTKRIDMLVGLKENVIIGRLIPTGEVYRKRFHEEEAAGSAV